MNDVDDDGFDYAGLSRRRDGRAAVLGERGSRVGLRRQEHARSPGHSTPRGVDSQVCMRNIRVGLCPHSPLLVATGVCCVQRAEKHVTSQRVLALQHDDLRSSAAMRIESI